MTNKSDQKVLDYDRYLVMKSCAERAEAAERQRDFLIKEYERAVGCGPKGFAHAAGHLFNAIVNARCDAKVAKRERDEFAALLEQPKISGVQEPRSSYDRLIIQRETGARLYCDPYELLAALDLRSPTIDHVIKKSWNPGGRSGGKTRQQDIKEIAWTARCAEQEEYHGNE